ncbi:MAG: phage head-tail connector protein [Pseudomonadota bacterium]
MTITVTTPPAEEPLTLSDAKAHLRVDASDEDAYIADAVVAARRAVEARTGLTLITQTLTWTFDEFPEGAVLALPAGPVQSVTAVRSYDADGVASVYGASNYTLDGGAQTPRVVRKAGAVWPTPGRNALGGAVEFVAGFGAAAVVPEDLVQAVRILTAHYFERRELSEADRQTRTPDGFEALIAPHRRVRL